MEFEKLVSSLDADALAQAAEALLRLLSGALPESALPLSASSARREARESASLPLSVPGAARPLSGAEGAGKGDLTAAEAPSSFAAVPGGEAAEETARIAQRSAADARRRPRSRKAAAEEELSRLEERLAAVSERNRRIFGTAETGTFHRSADGSAMADAAAAGAELSSAFSAPRGAGFGPGAAAGAEAADIRIAPAGAGAAGRDFFDAEAVSEFFRRDSRRYDSGSSD